MTEILEVEIPTLTKTHKVVEGIEFVSVYNEEIKMAAPNG